MRHILISSFLVLGTAGMASASERYPTIQRYVNHSGQVVSIEKTLTLRPIAIAPAHAVLPPVRTVPISPILASQSHGSDNNYDSMNHDSVNYERMNHDSMPFGYKGHFKERFVEPRNSHDCCTQTAVSHDADIYDADIMDE